MYMLWCISYSLHIVFCLFVCGLHGCNLHWESLCNLNNTEIQVGITQYWNWCNLCFNLANKWDTFNNSVCAHFMHAMHLFQVHRPYAYLSSSIISLSHQCTLGLPVCACYSLTILAGCVASQPNGALHLPYAKLVVWRSRSHSVTASPHVLLFANKLHRIRTVVVGRCRPCFNMRSAAPNYRCALHQNPMDTPLRQNFANKPLRKILEHRLGQHHSVVYVACLIVVHGFAKTLRDRAEWKNMDFEHCKLWDLKTFRVHLLWRGTLDTQREYVLFADTSVLAATAASCQSPILFMWPCVAPLLAPTYS